MQYFIFRYDIVVKNTAFFSQCTVDLLRMLPEPNRYILNAEHRKFQFVYILYFRISLYQPHASTPIFSRPQRLLRRPL